MIWLSLIALVAAVVGCGRIVEARSRFHALAALAAVYGLLAASVALAVLS